MYIIDTHFFLISTQKNLKSTHDFFSRLKVLKKIGLCAILIFLCANQTKVCDFLINVCDNLTNVCASQIKLLLRKKMRKLFGILFLDFWIETKLILICYVFVSIWIKKWERKHTLIIIFNDHLMAYGGNSCPFSFCSWYYYLSNTNWNK